MATALDEGPVQQDELDDLKWRGDPLETFSDWTIEILGVPWYRYTAVVQEDSKSDNDNNNNNNKDSTIFHVHKFTLGYGKRRSEYFAKLFRNKDHYQESEACTSRIELQPLMKDAFPFLLDFVYNPDQPLEISTATAVALHSLGDYFEMRNLRWEAKLFCMKDISLDTMDIYYEHARILHNHTILQLLARFLGRNILRVDPGSSPILGTIDPRLFLDSLEWVPRGTTSIEEVSLHMSQLVAEMFMRSQSDSLDVDTFRQLTRHSLLPHIHPEASLVLCEINDRVQKILVNNDFAGSVETGNALTAVATDESSSESEDTIDGESLPSRCATALCKHWRDILAMDKGRVDLLRSRQTPFLADLLVKSLKEAESSLVASEAALEDCHEIINTKATVIRDAELKLDMYRKTVASQKRQISQLKLLEEKHRTERSKAKADLRKVTIKNSCLEAKLVLSKSTRAEPH